MAINAIHNALLALYCGSSITGDKIGGGAIGVSFADPGNDLPLPVGCDVLDVSQVHSMNSRKT